MKQIVFSTAIDRFVIITDSQNIGVKLDNDDIEDGYLVLNDDQDEITKKAFDGLFFILIHELKETELKFAIYESNTDSLIIQSTTDKIFDTGSALEYAKGLETDSDEIKAKKLEAVLALKDFRIMCENLI